MPLAELKFVKLFHKLVFSYMCGLSPNPNTVPISKYDPIMLYVHQLLTAAVGNPNYTPRCEIKDPMYYKLIHRPEEELNLKSECILQLVSAMVHLPQEMKLWFANKCVKVVLNEKTINSLRVYPCLFHLLLHFVSSLSH